MRPQTPGEMLAHAKEFGLTQEEIKRLLDLRPDHYAPLKVLLKGDDMTDDPRKELLEQAYELAEYIHKHPANYTALYYRVRWLAHPVDDQKAAALVEEVEKWLEQFKAQGKE